MAQYHILYDNLGKYKGHTYGNSPPKIDSSNLFVKTLSPEEMDLVQNKFEKFFYDRITIIKLRHVYLSVSPQPVYTIGVDNKICISIVNDYDTSEEEKTWLNNKLLKISINDKIIDLMYKDSIFLNPTQPGLYTIKLADKRIYSTVDTYTVSVITK